MKKIIIAVFITIGLTAAVSAKAGVFDWFSNLFKTQGSQQQQLGDTINVLPPFVASSTINRILPRNTANGLTIPTTSPLRLSAFDCSVSGGGGKLTTDSSGNVVCAADGGGSGTVSGGQTGYVTTWASSTGLTYGTLIDNGTVAGANATSSTVNFNIQGSGTRNPFQINSSTGITLIRVSANGSVSIGTTTNASTLTVQGTTTLPALNLLSVASSSGTSFLNVNNIGNVNVATLTATNLVMTDASKNLASLNVVPTNVIANVSTGTTGTNFNISTTTNALVINLPNASASNNGQLLAADWTTFNNKLGAAVISLNGLTGATQTFTTSTGGTVFTINSSGTAHDFKFPVSPTFTTINVTGSSTLATLTAVSILDTELTSGRCVQSAAGGLFTSAAAACGSGGSGNAAWTLGLGLIYNATSTDTVIIGASATTSSATLFLQGNGSISPFVIASSTGITMAQFHRNGSLSLGTTTNVATLIVQGTTTLPSLDLFRVASSTGILAFQINSLNNVNIATLTATNLVMTDASKNLASLNVVPTNVIANVSTTSSGSLFYLSTTTNAVVFNFPISPTFTNVTMTNGSTTNLSVSGDLYTGLTVGRCVQVGTNSLLTAAAAACGSGGSGNSAWTIGSAVIYNATSTDAVGVGLTAPTATFHVQGNGAVNPFQINSSTGVTLLRINPNGSVGLGTTSALSLLYVQGTTTLPALDLLRVASSSGTTFLQVTSAGNVALGTTSASQLLQTDALNNVKSLNVVPTNVIANVSTGTAGTNFFVSTSTNALVINCPDSSASNRGCLTSGDWTTFNAKQAALSGGAVGQVAIWTSASAIGNGKLIDNGTVAGSGATSTNVAFTIQGIAGNNNVFNINTSTGATIVRMTPAGSWSMNSSTPNATMVVQGTTTSPALDILRIATSTGQTYLQVTNVGNVGINTGTPSSLLSIQGSSGGTIPLFAVASSTNGNVFAIQPSGDILITGVATSTTAFLMKNPAGQTVFQGDETAAFGGLTIGTTTTASLYAAAQFVVQGNSASTTAPLILAASSTNLTLFQVSPNGVVGSSSTAPTLSSCGTSPTFQQGSDNYGGRVTIGSTASGCTITFGIPFKVQPVCIVADETGSVVNTFSYTVSTTAIVATESTSGGQILNYLCKGNPN